MSDFQLQRLGMVMEPEPGNPQEIEGVLNPGAARGPDGHLYLFPRLVAQRPRQIQPRRQSMRSRKTWHSA
jgi:hypothetical protein